MRLKLLKYKIKLQYLPGKYMYVADLLSRSYLKDEMENDDPWISEIVYILSLLHESQCKKQNKKLVKLCTGPDL